MMNARKFVPFLLLLALAATACGAPTAAPPPVATEAPVGVATEAPVAPTEVALVPVRIAHTPFFDHQWIVVAKELGWDQELGLDFQLLEMSQAADSVAAMVSGDVDIIEGCIVCNFPARESVPELTVFATCDQFKGFLFVGRRGGDLKTYFEFLQELGDPEAAKEATLMQFEGRTFVYHRAVYDPLVGVALGQVDITLDDIESINFADDEKAALAFIGGTGDVYTGSLPQESRMLLELSDQFVNLGGSEILGPAGLWYSNMSSSADWIQENKDAVLKMIAIIYRYNRYIQEDPDTVLPIVTETMNRLTGANNTVEDVKKIFSTFLGHRIYQEEAETTYNPDSDLYWQISADYFVQEAIKQGNYPENGDFLGVNQQEELFNEFLQRQDLLDWVDAPLE